MRLNVTIIIVHMCVVHVRGQNESLLEFKITKSIVKHYI